jgi:hypothetical protein
MQWHWSTGSGGGREVRMMMTALGAFMILLSVLLYLYPNLLQLVIAGVFFIVGVSIITRAWGMRF